MAKKPRRRGKVRVAESSVAMSGSIGEEGQRRSERIEAAMNAAVRGLVDKDEHDPAKHLKAALAAREQVRREFAAEEAFRAKGT